MHQADQRPKRFYETVSVEREKGGYALRLDGKPVRTPLKKPLALPTRALAEAVAEEWRAQGERIDPETIPLTKLANSVIDGVHGNEEAVIDDIMAYVASDLLCYRADGRQELVAAQQAQWGPVFDWAKDALDAPFTLAEGVVHVAQPQASLDRIKERLLEFD
ncbi:MAG: ATPase, partial [Methyloceanibacter sp.]|nr:ATPase [Methyloceanibacter sp.]